MRVNQYSKTAQHSQLNQAEMASQAVWKGHKAVLSWRELMIQVIILSRSITMSDTFHIVTFFSNCDLIHF